MNRNFLATLSRPIRQSGLALLIFFAGIFAVQSNESDSDPFASLLSGPPPVTYIGETQEGLAVAVALTTGNRAVGYFCDGKRRGIWFKGQHNRKTDVIDLLSDNGLRIRGTLAHAEIVRKKNRNNGGVPFSLELALHGAGLFRAESSDESNRLLSGWIVNNSGKVVGVVSRIGPTTIANVGIVAETGSVQPKLSNPGIINPDQAKKLLCSALSLQVSNLVNTLEVCPTVNPDLAVGDSQSLLLQCALRDECLLRNGSRQQAVDANCEKVKNLKCGPVNVCGTNVGSVSGNTGSLGGPNLTPDPCSPTPTPTITL